MDGKLIKVLEMCHRFSSSLKMLSENSSIFPTRTYVLISARNGTLRKISQLNKLRIAATFVGSSRVSPMNSQMTRPCIYRVANK